jgi:hypothetical protein
MSIKRNGRTPKQRANTMRMLDPKKRGAMIENAKKAAADNPGDYYAAEYFAALLNVAASMGIDTVKP